MIIKEEKLIKKKMNRIKNEKKRRY